MPVVRPIFIFHTIPPRPRPCWLSTDLVNRTGVVFSTHGSWISR